MCDNCGCSDPERAIGRANPQPHAHPPRHEHAHAERRRVRVLNLVSSPGAGKTTLLERTLRDLAGAWPWAVIEGDQQTDNDARRIAARGVPVVQIKTGTLCHLDAQSGGRVSQRDVERILGRLLTDAGFRRKFSLNPAHACLVLGAGLAPEEFDALLQVPLRRLASLAETLDDRICRLHIEAFEEPHESQGDQ